MLKLKIGIWLVVVSAVIRLFFFFIYPPRYWFANWTVTLGTLSFVGFIAGAILLVWALFTLEEVKS